MLAVGDEFTREWLAMVVERRPGSEALLDRLTELFLRRGTPASMRAAHGAEVTAKAVRKSLSRLAVRRPYIERWSPLENGYVESCIDKLRHELLTGEILYTLEEEKVPVARWR